MTQPRPLDCNRPTLVGFARVLARAGAAALVVSGCQVEASASAAPAADCTSPAACTSTGDAAQAVTTTSDAAPPAFATPLVSLGTSDGGVESATTQPTPAATELWLRSSENQLLVAELSDLVDQQPLPVTKRFGTLAAGPAPAAFDRTGNLWLGDISGHLVRYPRAVFAAQGNTNLPAPDETHRALDVDDLGFLPCWLDREGNIWAGRYERYALRAPGDRLDGTAEELRSSPFYDLRLDVHGLQSLGFDADNRVYAAVRTWLAQFSEGEIPDRGGGSVAPQGIELSPRGDPASSWQLEFDGSGNLWAAQAGQLMRVARDALVEHVSQAIPSTTVTLADERMRAALGGRTHMHFDSLGNMWLSSVLPYLLEFDAATLAAVGRGDGPARLVATLEIDAPAELDTRIVQSWVR